MKPDFEKGNGLLPAIIQDCITGTVLMLGYMNAAAYEKTLQENKVCFFSRTKNRLWTKGEASGNFLLVKSVTLDCDNDTLLVKAEPTGPVCHTGAATCFGEENKSDTALEKLEATISQRIDENVEGSYSNELYKKGINKMAQKVGEEAVELVIEAMDNNEELFINEAADLMYHLLVLCKGKNIPFSRVEAILKERST
ncbi:MAG: bifunctional phosphoribosyl-AMP cyclohydrolase/phosphoribosyl-ATP diphosphatase HisIE [Ferruginibacter sp.]